MGKYRKKPVVVDAVQFNIGDPQPDWVTEAIHHGIVVLDGDQLSIRTLEGVMVSNPGDYIIKGVQGEIYPCKPDVFEATYELA